MVPNILNTSSTTKNPSYYNYKKSQKFTNKIVSFINVKGDTKECVISQLQQKKLTILKIDNKFFLKEDNFYRINPTDRSFNLNSVYISETDESLQVVMQKQFKNGSINFKTPLFADVKNYKLQLNDTNHQIWTAENVKIVSEEKFNEMLNNQPKTSETPRTQSYVPQEKTSTTTNNNNNNNNHSSQMNVDELAIQPLIDKFFNFGNQIKLAKFTHQLMLPLDQLISPPIVPERKKSKK